MKMRSFFLAFATLLMLFCFSISSYAVNIELTVRNVKQNGIVLTYKSAKNQSMQKDINLVNGKAKVTINEPIEKYTLFTLKFEGFTTRAIGGFVYSTIASFYASDQSDIKIEVNGVNDYSLVYSVADNLDNDVNKRLMRYNDDYNKVASEFNRLTVKMEQMREKVTPTNLEGKDAVIAANKILRKDPEFMKMMEERGKVDSGTDLKLNYIKKNLDLLSISFLWQAYSNRLLQDDEVEKLYSCYPNDIQGLIYGKWIKERLGERKSTHEGNIVASLKGKMVDGSVFDLANFIGKKYILIDFYGTWCGPCMKGMPHISEFYHKHTNVLEVISVCCQDRENKWRAFLDAHKEYDWIHIFDYNNSLIEKFAIDGFPTKLLIDKSGKIIYRALGENLSDYETIEKMICQ